MTYHVAREGETIAEVSEGEFRSRIFSGEFQPDDHYWTDGMSDWKVVSEWHPPTPTVKMKTATGRAVATPLLPSAGAIAPPLPSPNDKLCLHCGFIGRPKLITKGTFGTELLLYFCFVVPGLLYSLWRLTTRCRACPMCEMPNMIPAGSPAARQYLARTTA